MGPFLERDTCNPAQHNNTSYMKLGSPNAIFHYSKHFNPFSSPSSSPFLSPFSLAPALPLPPVRWRVRYFIKMGYIFSVIEYYLVKHPTIQNFSWIPGKTLGSSPHFLFFTILSYLSFTFILSHLSLPSLPPLLLRSISIVHNIFLLSLSFIMALGCLLSTISHAPDIQWIICFPFHTPPSGPLFFWAYIFYLSKIIEFIDTLLIILSNSIQRLTFLHVYHHSTVVIMCYIWLHTSQSLFPAVLVTNASVHVLMYTYYLSCALGVRPTWKKLVTDCQIVQFYSSFVVLGLMLHYHFNGSGCSGAWGWSFNVVFYASLLALFVDFHKNNYGSSSKKIVHNNVKSTKPLISCNSK